MRANTLDGKVKVEWVGGRGWKGATGEGSGGDRGGGRRREGKETNLDRSLGGGRLLTEMERGSRGGRVGSKTGGNVGGGYLYTTVRGDLT